MGTFQMRNAEWGAYSALILRYARPSLPHEKWLRAATGSARGHRRLLNHEMMNRRSRCER